MLVAFFIFCKLQNNIYIRNVYSAWLFISESHNREYCHLYHQKNNIKFNTNKLRVSLCEHYIYTAITLSNFKARCSTHFVSFSAIQFPHNLGVPSYYSQICLLILVTKFWYSCSYRKWSHQHYVANRFRPMPQ